ASYSRYATRNLLLQVTTARRVLEEVTQVVVERPGPRADLDGALMNRATGKTGNQPACALGHVFTRQALKQGHVGESGQLVWGQSALDGVLHGAQKHRHAGAVGVVPVDVVEHLLARVHQRMQRRDALVVDP